MSSSSRGINVIPKQHATHRNSGTGSSLMAKRHSKERQAFYRRNSYQDSSMESIMETQEEKETSSKFNLSDKPSTPT